METDKGLNMSLEEASVPRAGKMAEQEVCSATALTQPSAEDDRVEILSKENSVKRARVSTVVSG